jgi:hypothetical protein
MILAYHKNLNKLIKFAQSHKLRYYPVKLEAQNINPIMKATAKAPANIAFIKFWGKKDSKLNIPFSNTLSVSLDNVFTVTTVEFSKEFKKDSIEIDGEKKLAEQDRLMNHLDNIRKVAKTDLKELLEVEGIGEVVAESILTWFRDPENIELLEKFKKYGVKPEEVEVLSDGKLDGISFVITGSITGMSREEAADRIRELGGTFQSSVGKGTTYLVSGGSVGESKLKKAEKFGTVVINGKDFLKLIQ